MEWTTRPVGAGARVALCAWMLAGGCGYPPLTPSGTDAGPAPTPADSGVDGVDGGPTADAGRAADAGTGLGARSVPSNLLLLLDRSGSMAGPTDCGEASCPSKWEQVLALGGYLEQVKRGARLGASFFPGIESRGDACGVDPYPAVPLDDADDVDRWIVQTAERTRPEGRTPLVAALEQVGLNGGLDDRRRDNNLVILTDGHPNCACAATDGLECERAAAVAAIAALAEADPPVDVYVIGFGASAREADATLGAMARAAGKETYYQADTIGDLLERLYEVAVANVSCTFALDAWPEPEALVVWLDDRELAACEAEPCLDGYDYDPSAGRVDLRGAACATLRDGAAHRVWFDRREPGADAGVRDAGVRDAGVAVDAGDPTAPDAGDRGAPDAGSRDGGGA